jgi:uncharacterized membrane protein required for colicin V production
VLLALVLGLAIRGVFRGTVPQVFTFFGLLLGLWAAVSVSQWVGAHWQGARPAVVFLALRWLVAALVGLAAASLMQWWGGLLGTAVRESPIGWLDRALGFAVGAAFGAMVCAGLVLLALLAPLPRGGTRWVARATATPLLMRGGERMCAVGNGQVPGSRWLQQRFQSAERRIALSAHPS